MATDMYDDFYGFGDTDSDSESDCSSDEDCVWDDPELPDLDMKFKKSGLWQAPEMPLYDERHYGPQNMPDGYRKFSPLQIFTLLFPLKLWELIKMHTNLYAWQLADESHTEQNPVDVTVKELLVWVALHLKMMRAWHGQQDQYWTPNGAFDAKQYMPRGRFYWIKSHLHFANKDEQPDSDDKLFLLRPLLDMFNKTFREHWRPSAFVSLDEMMMPFKGRNPFHFYIPRKPHANGCKLHAICCARGYFCVAFLFDDKGGFTIAEIARALFAMAVRAGMTVITDRYYTCTDLVRFCIARNVGLVGSTRSNRWLAKNKVSGRWTGAAGKKKARGTYESFTNGDGTVCCAIWKDKGVVRLTMTAGDNTRAKVWRRTRGAKPGWVTCPRGALVYDKYFHGVDRNDQLRSSLYGLALHFKAQKWTVKMFFGLLDVVLSNAWILWRTIHPKDTKKHADWLARLAEELLAWNPCGDPVYRERKSTPAPVTPLRQHPVRCTIREGPDTPRSGRRVLGLCRLCLKVAKRRKRVTTGCAICAVALCARPHAGAETSCHAQWHDLSDAERKRYSKRMRKQMEWDSPT
jgi:hypothetical protein